MRILNLVLFVFMMTAGSCLSAQTIKVSSYGFENPSKALVSAMKSDNDTLIIDLQDEPWILKPMKFIGINNKVILLEEGVELRALAGAYPRTSQALLKFIDCENIQILGKNNVLAMNKAEYTDGEWRHVIRLRGCKNVLIENLTLRDSGGDGISIGRSEKVMFSEDIRLGNIKSINNKRQGISIVSGKNVHVSNSVFTETNGTLPGAGVDIEPDLAEEVICNVVFENCTFTNNFHAGIKIALGKLTSGSEPVSVTFKDCFLSGNFSPENPKPPAEIFIRANKLDPVKGSVVFENCLISNSKWGMLYAQKNAESFSVDFINCAAKNIRLGSKGPAIYLEVPHYREVVDVGGLHFKDLFLDYDLKEPVITVQGSRRGTLRHLRDISGNITTRETSVEDFEYLNYDKTKNIGVDLQIIGIKP